MSKKTGRILIGAGGNRPTAVIGSVMASAGAGRMGSIFGSLTMPGGKTIRTMDERAFRSALSQSKKK
jgi:ribulose 1,5-bisphosphate synthetase/thiazole synthase